MPPEIEEAVARLVAASRRWRCPYVVHMRHDMPFKFPESALPDVLPAVSSSQATHQTIPNQTLQHASVQSDRLPILPTSPQRGEAEPISQRELTSQRELSFPSSARAAPLSLEDAFLADARRRLASVQKRYAAGPPHRCARAGGGGGGGGRVEERSGRCGGAVRPAERVPGRRPRPAPP